MAEINAETNERRRAGVHRMKKHSLKTDMTPMVDLGFLLIAFFVVTTELSKPRVTDLFVPKDSIIDMPVSESAVLTVLLTGDNAVFHYEGKWEDAVSGNRILKTTFSAQQGLRDIIRQKKAAMEQHPAFKNGKDELMLIIKPGKDAAYNSVIDALDEALIGKVKKYMVIKPDAVESAWLQQQ